MQKFLIIGAGINGLLTARELAAAGAAVIVLEKGECFGEASWAGGGIVSPLYPWRYSPAVTALATWAQTFYPHLARELRIDSEIDPELEANGLLMLHADDARQALDWAQANGRNMQAVDAGFIYDREPHLAPGFDRALWMPEVNNIRNPLMGRALLKSLRQQANVSIRENTEVTGFETRGNTLTAVQVRTTDGTERIAAERFLVCAGAWSTLLTSRLEVRVGFSIEPVKGQMLLFKTDAPLVNSIVLHAGRYLIPRRDGHLLVGSTLEHSGFDKTTSAAALESLRASAITMLPELADLPLKAQWSGLRPAAPDGIPYIGRVPGYANCFINAGQYRNGLVLAPASARLLVDLLFDRSPVVDPGPYDPASRLSPGPAS